MLPNMLRKGSFRALLVRVVALLSVSVAIAGGSLLMTSGPAGASPTASVSQASLAEAKLLTFGPKAGRAAVLGGLAARAHGGPAACYEDFAPDVEANSTFSYVNRVGEMEVVGGAMPLTIVTAEYTWSRRALDALLDCTNGTIALKPVPGIPSWTRDVSTAAGTEIVFGTDPWTNKTYGAVQNTIARPGYVSPFSFPAPTGYESSFYHSGGKIRGTWTVWPDEFYADKFSGSESNDIYIEHGVDAGDLVAGRTYTFTYYIVGDRPDDPRWFFFAQRTRREPGCWFDLWSCFYSEEAPGYTHSDKVIRNEPWAYVNSRRAAERLRSGPTWPRPSTPVVAGPPAPSAPPPPAPPVAGPPAPSAPPPPAPSVAGPSAPSCVVSGSSVQVSWRAVSGSTLYRAYQRVANTAGSGDQFAAGRGLQAGHYALTPGTSYQYRVGAVVNDREAFSGWSSPCGIAFAPPSGISPPSCSVSGRSVSISWRAASGSNVEYKAEVKDSSGAVWQIGAGSGLNINWPNGRNGESYQFRVRAVNSDGSVTSGWSSACRVVVAPSSPGTPACTARSNGNVTVSWSRSDGRGVALDLYEIRFRNADSKVVNSRQLWAEASATSLVHDNVTAGSRVQYKAIAVSPGGVTHSGWSATCVAGRPPASTGTPSCSALDDGSVRVSWNASNGFGTDLLPYRVDVKDVHSGQVLDTDKSLWAAHPQTSAVDRPQPGDVRQYRVTIANGVTHIDSNWSAPCSSGSPKGALDNVTSPGPGQIRVSGWAFDPSDVAAPVDIHAYVDDKGHNLDHASKSRGDVERVWSGRFPGMGSNHGFAQTFDTIATGAQRVCAYAIDIGHGRNQQLGCVAGFVGDVAWAGSARVV